MPKKNVPPPIPLTHFELVPLEVVVKIAAIDPPLRLSPALVEAIMPPSPPKSQGRTKK